MCVKIVRNKDDYDYNNKNNYTIYIYFLNYYDNAIFFIWRFYHDKSTKHYYNIHMIERHKIHTSRVREWDDSNLLHIMF